MGTFLVTPKMSPELRARVEASVTGKKPGTKSSRALVTLARVAVIAVVLGGAALLVLVRPSCHDDLESERAIFIGEVKQEDERVTDDDRAMVSRVESFLGARVGDYEGDLVPKELRDPKAFAATFARPILYLRGTTTALASSSGIASSAEESFRDAFVLCLVSPPAKRTEKTLLQRARAAFAGGESPADNVERFQSVLVGAPFLDPAWIDKIKAAKTQRDIGTLRAQRQKAQIDTVVRAMKSELLLVVIDEPKEGDQPSELDGAFAHHARVELADLATGDVILRVRKFIDPAWISEGSRVEYATGINACELGLEVRNEVLGTAGSPSPAPTSSASASPKASTSAGPVSSHK